MTGFNEPDAVAVIQKVGSTADYIFHLFLRPKDPRAELWDGARSGEQAALDVFNADEVPLLSKPIVTYANIYSRVMLTTCTHYSHQSSIVLEKSSQT